jgi:hypothetical protein
MLYVPFYSAVAAFEKFYKIFVSFLNFMDTFPGVI